MNRPLPHQMLWEARRIAREAGCFLSEKRDPRGPIWLLYRENPRPDGKPIYLGKRHSPAAIRLFVYKVCLSITPARRRAMPCAS